MSKPSDGIRGQLDPATVAYPRHAMCPKCQGHLNTTGWCGDCARRRIVWWTVALALLAPPIGCGMCAPFVRLTPPDSTAFENAMIIFGSLVCCAGPIVVVICGAVAYGVANQRSLKGPKEDA